MKMNDVEGASSRALGAFLSPASFWRPDYIVSSAWLEHAPFAFWLVGVLRPRSLVELGTHAGYSYFAFCQAIAAMGSSAQAYAVDTWRGDAMPVSRRGDIEEASQSRTALGRLSTLVRATSMSSVAVGGGFRRLLHMTVGTS